MNGLHHITTLVNLLCVALLGLRYYELDIRFHEHDKLHHKHEESIANINDHLSRNDDEISTIKLEKATQQQSKHRGDAGLMEDIVTRPRQAALPVKSEPARKSPVFSATDESEDMFNMDDSTQLEHFAEIEKILSKKVSQSTHHPMRKTIQIQTSDNVETTCLLKSYDNSTYVQTFDHEYSINSDSSITFNLYLDLRTDRKPSETSWNLSPRGNDTKKVIDSKEDGQTVELLPETPHTMIYSCLVSSTEEDELDKSSICYDFKIEDLRANGMCCLTGVGSFSLRLNEAQDPIYSGTQYAKYKKVSFCLGDDTNVSEEDDDDSELYPSKECLDDKCICNSKPNLLSNFDNIESKYPGLHELKSRSMMNILILSGSELLRDISSPQYMAACWTLNDDPYLTQYNNATAVRASDAEKRMMQRYILAVLYFSNNPRNWVNDYRFLTSNSECDWNTDLLSFNPPFSPGARCDEKDNIISFMSFRNNLEGSIIEEISGLKSLEYLILYADIIRGTIPPSIGRLSELQFFGLPDLNLIEGTLPPELFNAKKLQYINIRGTKITGTIPQDIGNIQGLQHLELSFNDLTGSIPEEFYSLTELIYLYINDNMLSSTISSSIGNLQQLDKFRGFGNQFTGPLPSQLGSLSKLKELSLMRNKFSGTVPSSFKSLVSAEQIDLFETDLRGEVPDELCEIDPRPAITADCRNDIFSPELKCSCCSYCTDKTPIWDGICPDVQLKFNIDHVRGGQWISSELLQWSITDTATNRKLIGDGPYTRGVTLEPSYETCVASSDCLVLNMKAEPLVEKHWNAPDQTFIEFKTNYSIYWNDKLVLEDAFELDVFNLKELPEVTFQYDALTDQIQVGSSCAVQEITCDGETLVLNPVQRVMYNTAFKVSGAEAFDDVDSSHSKVLCWIIKDDTMYDNKDISEIETHFSQRYVLALLHQASKSGLFGSDEFPPPSHECSWEGITCPDGKDKMTSLVLSSSANQIIGGTLIEEIGSLAFLEILHLNQTGLKGTIPSVFSNLYSLRELDLSGNALTGSIPDNFFDQLGRLELFDLSDNYSMSGTIPASIGSHSDIEVIRLSTNRFTGELPLGNFTRYNLKVLDVGKNELSGSISPSLLKHRNLEYLDLGTNFFVGSIQESILDDLIQLKHFDVSQNQLMGVIPPLNHNMSDITFFDMHANRIAGTLPVSLTGMTTLNYLNLQGNEITGSIPSEMNNLEGLHTLLLSHNKFKGSIPLTFNKLTNMNYLHLQSNQLSGKAPINDKGMDAYVTDCGFPTVALDPVICPSCNICCNADEECARQYTRTLRPTMIAIIFFFSMVAFMAIVYTIKNRFLNTSSIRGRFEESVMFWKPSDMLGDKSVYHFFLTPSTQGWFVGLFCALAQMATLFLFIEAADIANEQSDLEYSVTCSMNSLECEDENSLNSYGGLIFGLIIFVWLMKDIIASFKLLLIAMWKKNIDYFFGSMIILLVTALSAWTSVYYNLAIATKNTDLIVNAVILLFVNELDERMYQLVDSLNLSWAMDVNESLERNSYHEASANRLNVTRAANKIRKRVLGMHDSVSSFRRSREDGDVVVRGETENVQQDVVEQESNTVAQGIYTYTKNPSPDLSNVQQDVVEQESNTVVQGMYTYTKNPSPDRSADLERDS